MPIENLQELLEKGLAHLLSAEEQLVEALPAMIHKASAASLKEALEEHLEQTKSQFSRLQEVRQAIGATETATDSVMKELISAGEDTVSDIENPQLRDIAITMAGQKIEHYEIACYASAIAIADELWYDNAIETLQETLDEENDAADKLADISQNTIEQMDTDAEEEE